MAENIWEYIRGDDVAEAMRLVGCDEKYISGNASDFEKFREWHSILPLFEGCETMEKSCKRIGVAIGEELTLARMWEYTAPLIWQKYTSLNSSVYVDLTIKKCDEKNNYRSSCRVENTTVDYFNKSADILSFAKCLDGGYGEDDMIAENLEKPITVRFFDGEFDRPDRYAAENALKRILLGEKCNNKEKNILLCQLVCEIIYAKKDNYPIFVFDVKNGSACTEGLIKYLVKRSLGARIYLLTDIGIQPQEVRALCLLGNRDCFVTPLIAENDTEYLRELGKIYPRGLITCK